MNKVIANLHIRVIYDTSEKDVSIDEIKYTLKNAGNFLNHNGLLSQEMDVVVDDCKIEVDATPGD